MQKRETSGRTCLIILIIVSAALQSNPKAKTYKHISLRPARAGCQHTSINGAGSCDGSWAAAPTLPHTNITVPKQWKQERPENQEPAAAQMFYSMCISGALLRPWIQDEGVQTPPPPLPLQVQIFKEVTGEDNPHHPTT